MDINWAQVIVYVVVGLVSGVIGGTISGFILAFRLGQWKEKVDGRLSQLELDGARRERRLDSGSQLLDKVPIVNVQLDNLSNEIKTFRQVLHETQDEFVTRRECDLRHGGPA